MTNKILILNPFAGAAGDMILGGFIDLGVPLEYIKSELKKVEFRGYRVQESSVFRKSLTARRVEVLLDNPKKRVTEHVHSSGSYENDHFTKQGYRTWREVQSLIKESGLSRDVKSLTHRCFELLAVAESKAHGAPLEKVHFHEVGATDSLVDIIGTCIAVEYLKPGKIICTPVSVGSGGFVDCSHGRLPVPTPATLNILSGKPVRPQPVEKELCTPTGAALLVGLAESFSGIPTDIKIEKVGTGAGSREGAGELPGIFRIILAEKISSKI